MPFDLKKDAPDAESLFTKAVEAQQEHGQPPSKTPASDVTGGQRPTAALVQEIVSQWTDEEFHAAKDKTGKDDPEKGHEAPKKNDAFPEFASGIQQDFVADSAGPTHEIDIGMPETTPIGGTEMGGGGGGGGGGGSSGGGGFGGGGAD